MSKRYLFVIKNGLNRNNCQFVQACSGSHEPLDYPIFPSISRLKRIKTDFFLKKTANTIASSKKCRTFAPVIEKEIILTTINGM